MPVNIASINFTHFQTKWGIQHFLMLTRRIHLIRFFSFFVISVRKMLILVQWLQLFWSGSCWRACIMVLESGNIFTFFRSSACHHQIINILSFFVFLPLSFQGNCPPPPPLCLCPFRAMPFQNLVDHLQNFQSFDALKYLLLLHYLCLCSSCSVIHYISFPNCLPSIYYLRMKLLEPLFLTSYKKGNCFQLNSESSIIRNEKYFWCNF